MLASLPALLTFPLGSGYYFSCLGYPSTPSCVHRATRFNVIATRCRSRVLGGSHAEGSCELNGLHSTLAYEDRSVVVGRSAIFSNVNLAPTLDDCEDHDLRLNYLILCHASFPMRSELKRSIMV